MAALPAALRFRVRLQCEQLEDRTVPAGLQPTAMEQLLLEQLNDARANPAAYGQSIGLDLSGVAASQPLAFNALLIEAAHLHAQDMNDRRFFSHTNPSGQGPGQRLAAAGFSATAWAESIAAGYATTSSALAGLIRDVGVPDLGHRRHLLAIDTVFQSHNQVGVGVVQNGSGPYGNYYVIDTGRTSDTRAFLTGAVFRDADSDGRYDVGEGLSGVTITVAGVGSAAAFDTGGYSFALRPGTYTVTASGGGLSASITRTVTIGSQNVRVQFIDGSASDPVLNAAFVDQAYVDLLGRSADAAGRAYWVNQLNQGMSRTQVAAFFIASAEYRTKLVQNYYQTYLERTAGEAEVIAWVAFLQRGGTADQMKIAFLASAEYYALQGGSESGFVTALYVDVLGRTADAAGAAYHQAVLAGGGSRSLVAATFVNSLENRVREVRGFYLKYLRRFGDSFNVNAWASVLANGTPRESVIAAFVGSAEYYQRLR